MDPKKEQWKEEVLKSLENIQPAKPNPFLFAKIQHKLEEQRKAKTSTFLSRPVMSLAFAAVAFLIGLNFFAISQLTSPSSGNLSYHTVGSSPEDETSYAIISQDPLNLYQDETSFTY